MIDRLKWADFEDTSSNTVSDDEFNTALKETSAGFDDVLRKLSE